MKQMGGLVVKGATVTVQMGTEFGTAVVQQQGANDILPSQDARYEGPQQQPRRANHEEWERQQMMQSVQM